MPYDGKRVSRLLLRVGAGISLGSLARSAQRRSASDLADALAAAQLAERGLTHPQARVLWEIAEGRADAEWQRRGGENRRVSVALLERSGLILEASGRLQMSDGARISLADVV